MRTITGSPDFWRKNSIPPESLGADQPLSEETVDSGYEIVTSQDVQNSMREFPLTSCRIRLWIHSHGIEAMALLKKRMAIRWLPNTADFFFSLASLIEDSERQLTSASYDNSEFLFRRLDEYERTLSTLLSRFVKTYGNVPAVYTDLNYLCNRVSFLRSHFEQRHLLDWDNNCSSRDSRHGNVLSFENEHVQDETYFYSPLFDV
ncbi:hypothetical protein OS493_016730 [Desmophyllum pertusum]|uniref:Uncharacterized protein n=1 Tax=Desmophyllum pertusum TaxID=174260 RepID=A0A9X0CRB5_9CNID|nr:hypothetical protein OS493_016730 [Desmophyllum pertusum]